MDEQMIITIQQWVDLNNTIDNLERMTNSCFVILLIALVLGLMVSVVELINDKMQKKEKK